VVHDEVVSLEDRFVYLFKTYARTPEAVDLLTLMKDDTVKLEREIFLLLDFGPDDLVDLLEADVDLRERLHFAEVLSELCHRGLVRLQNV